MRASLSKRALDNASSLWHDRETAEAMFRSVYLESFEIDYRD